jgi:hypothetical protein
MPAEPKRPRPPGVDPEQQPDELPSPRPGADQDYRELERAYHRSAAYAAMVERYPLLRRTIHSYRGSTLVGGPSWLPQPEAPAVLLQWERSHGDG